MPFARLMAFALGNMPHPEEKGYIISISIESHNRMDENRLQAYLELIQTLMNCPSGEESQILQAYSELVDAGLVAVMREFSKQMTAEGKRNAVNKLNHFADEISQMLKMTISATPQEYFQFLIQVLQVTAESQGNPKVVYPLLKSNLDKLDDGLTLILSKATQTLEKENPKKAQSISAELVNLGNLISQFPLTNKASNQETAIVAYQSALKIYTRHKFPQEWAMIQNNLANVYSERIRGEK